MSGDRTIPWRPAILALLGLWLAAPAMAQQPLEMPRLLDPARMGPVTFRIFSGRVTMQGLRLGSYTTSTAGKGRNERLSLSMNNNQLVLSYESTSPTEHLSVEAVGSERLVIRRRPQGDSNVVPVELEQTAFAPLCLTLEPKEGKQVYRAASLWHLLIAHRAACGQSVFPLLKILNRDWDLPKTTEQVESALLSEATARDLPNRRQWATLVEQLGDDRFSTREAADHHLREAGRAVVTYLRQLDSNRLDAEQRYRIRRITQALSTVEDTQSPDETVAWLSGDPAVWLIFLARDDEPTRRLAAARLESLLGKPIQFNPAADAATRNRQLESLRRQFSID